MLSRARRFPLPDGPGQVELQVRQVDLNRFFIFISYKQIGQMIILRKGKPCCLENGSHLVSAWMCKIGHKSPHPTPTWPPSYCMIAAYMPLVPICAITGSNVIRHHRCQIASLWYIKARQNGCHFAYGIFVCIFFHENICIVYFDQIHFTNLLLKIELL